MENIKQMIDNLRELADKALAFRPESSLETRLLMAEAKVEELQTYNEFLENQNVELKSYVEYSQKVFATLDLYKAASCIFSEEELDSIESDSIFALSNDIFLNKSLRHSIILKTDAAKKIAGTNIMTNKKSKTEKRLLKEGWNMNPDFSKFLLELECISRLFKVGKVQMYGSQAILEIKFIGNTGCCTVILNKQ